ncbi:hypothetical protein P261_00375 [Lachnospiraceae bacterium TWA4]|nr:hypothetical protein P261_00375 [Lachnospiraceae bacterium TWA4]
MEAYSNNDVKVLSGDVLLTTTGFDWDVFRMQLFDDWHIEVIEEASENQLVFKIGEVTIACGYVEGFKEGSVEAAERSQEWADAAQVVKNHKAYIEVGVLDCQNALQRSVLFTMVAASLLKAENAMGLFKYPVVYRAGNYVENAQGLKEDNFPILNWVYIGIYKKENGNFGGYTYGLEDFNKLEIEVLETKNGAYELYQFLYQLASYLISNNITLEDGTKVEEYEVRYSKGAVLEGQTAKINF